MAALSQRLLQHFEFKKRKKTFSTMTTEEYCKDFRYIKFDGNTQDFLRWKVKTLSFARRNKFDKYLKADMTKSKKKEDVRGNNYAWDQLLFSLHGTPFFMILECEGNAYQAWKMLQEKYEVS